jgi:hypothetical protein
MKVTNPSANYGGIGGKEATYKITDEGTFIRPASSGVFSGIFHENNLYRDFEFCVKPPCYN